MRISNSVLPRPCLAFGPAFSACLCLGSLFGLPAEGVNNPTELDARKGDDQNHITLIGHTDTVTSLAFSPDGKILASGSLDATIRLWDLTTHNVVATLDGREAKYKGVCAVAISPDGKLLATASDKAIKLWDLASRTELKNLRGHKDTVMSVAFSPDGKTLASATGERKGDGEIRLWDVGTGKLTSNLEGHSFYVVAVAFSPDGRMLASAAFDDTVRLWEVFSGRERATFQGPNSRGYYSLAFSPNGRTVAAGYGTGIIQIWNVYTQQEVRTLNNLNGLQIEALAFSPDGKTLASGGPTLKLWNVITGDIIRDFKGHKPDIRCVVFSPDGKTLASGGTDKTIKLWDLRAVK